MRLDGKELRILISLIIVYSLFVHWIGWNENTRLDLVRAIAEEGRLSIDTYHKNTGDRLKIGGSYYSDKAPGTSIVSVPAYLAVKPLAGLAGSFLGAHEPGGETIEYSVSDAVFHEPVDPGFMVLTAMIALTIFASSIPSAFSAIIFRRILLEYSSEDKADLITVVFALGTVVFQYSIVYMGYSLAVFFMLAGWLRLVKEESGRGNYFSPGILLGLSCLFEYSMIALMPGFIAYKIMVRKKGYRKLITGMLVGLTPLIIYQFMLSGAGIPYLGLDPQVREVPGVEDCSGGKSLSVQAATCPARHPDRLIQLLLKILAYPYRGLLFYSPALILAFLGAAKMKKENPKALALCVSAITPLIIFIAWLGACTESAPWWGGSFFGPRLLSPLTAFFCLPLAYLGKKHLKALFVLTAISVLINIAGLQNPENMISEDGVLIKQGYMEKLYSFKPIASPLKSHYTPQTLRNGPRSRIIENLFDDAALPVDIRDCAHSKKREDCTVAAKKWNVVGSARMIGFIQIKPALITILTIAFSLAIIWREKTGRLLTDRRILAFTAILTILLLNACTRTTREIHEGFIWEPERPGYYWLNDKAFISIYSSKQEPQTLRFQAGSFHQPRSILIKTDNKVEGELLIPTEKKRYSIKLDLKLGENMIILENLGGCDIPADSLAESSDQRCLGIEIKDLRIN